MDVLNSDPKEAIVAVRELEAVLNEELRTVHDRLTLVQDTLDERALAPIRRLEQRISELDLKVDRLSNDTQESTSRVEEHEVRIGVARSKLDAQEQRLALVSDRLDRALRSGGFPGSPTRAGFLSDEALSPHSKDDLRRLRDRVDACESRLARVSAGSTGGAGAAGGFTLSVSESATLAALERRMHSFEQVLRDVQATQRRQARASDSSPPPRRSPSTEDPEFAKLREEGRLVEAARWNRFAGRSPELAQRAHEGFTDVRSHLDAITDQLETLRDRVLDDSQPRALSIGHRVGEAEDSLARVLEGLRLQETSASTLQKRIDEMALRFGALPGRVTALEERYLVAEGEERFLEPRREVHIQDGGSPRGFSVGRLRQLEAALADLPALMQRLERSERELAILREGVRQGTVTVGGGSPRTAAITAPPPATVTSGGSPRAAAPAAPAAQATSTPVPHTASSPTVPTRTFSAATTPVPHGVSSPAVPARSLAPTGALPPAVPTTPSVPLATTPTSAPLPNTTSSAPLPFSVRAALTPTSPTSPTTPKSPRGPASTSPKGGGAVGIGVHRPVPPAPQLNPAAAGGPSGGLSTSASADSRSWAAALASSWGTSPAATVAAAARTPPSVLAALPASSGEEGRFTLTIPTSPRTAPGGSSPRAAGQRSGQAQSPKRQEEPQYEEEEEEEEEDDDDDYDAARRRRGLGGMTLAGVLSSPFTFGGPTRSPLLRRSRDEDSDDDEASS